MQHDAMSRSQVLMSASTSLSNIIHWEHNAAKIFDNNTCFSIWSLPYLLYLNYLTTPSSIVWVFSASTSTSTSTSNSIHWEYNAAKIFDNDTVLEKP